MTFINSSKKNLGTAQAILSGVSGKQGLKAGFGFIYRACSIIYG